MARGPLVLACCLGLALVAGAPRGAAAAEWGGITPGVSTPETVRARYGPPSSEVKQKVEGYDTLRWVYEGPRAPRGMKRMTVNFGLLTPEGYRPGVVRFFSLEPKHEIFSKRVILNGWGVPDGVGEEGGRQFFFYESGLKAYFDKTSPDPLEMIFVVPQPAPAEKK